MAAVRTFDPVTDSRECLTRNAEPDELHSWEGSVMSLEQLQDEIELRLDRGEPLADVEAEVVDSAGAASEDERAALWLFAWSYRACVGHDAGQSPMGLPG